MIWGVRRVDVWGKFCIPWKKKESRSTECIPRYQGSSAISGEGLEGGGKDYS